MMDADNAIDNATHAAMLQLGLRAEAFPEIAEKINDAITQIVTDEDIEVITIKDMRHDLVDFLNSYVEVLTDEEVSEAFHDAGLSERHHV